MGNGKKQAEKAAAAVMRVLAASPGQCGVEAAAEIIELALHDAAREQEKKELMRIADVQVAAHAHLCLLRVRPIHATFSHHHGLVRVGSKNFTATEDR